MDVSVLRENSQTGGVVPRPIRSTTTSKDPPVTLIVPTTF
jgi:hypothetical protein